MDARRSARRGLHLRSDEGAVAVITALTLTVLLLVAAIVIDLASLRADRSNSKSVADLAVTAAVVEYDPLSGGSAQQACLEAVAFAQANLRLPGLVLTADVSCESQFPDPSADPNNPAEICSASWDPPLTARYSVGDHEIEITIPVPDGSPLMGAQASTAQYDGEECDRVGVRVFRDRSFTLAQVAGFDSGRTSQASVARWRPEGEEDQFASLVVLQRVGCTTLGVSGQDGVEVLDGPPAEEGGPPTPGSITLDTRADGCNPSSNGAGGPVINLGPNASATIQASGAIFVDGLNTQSLPQVYQSARVDSGQLSPRPRSGALISRKPIDHRYNCRDYTGTSNDRWSPVYSGTTGYPQQPIPACTQNLDDEAAPPPSPHIERLVDAYQGLTANQIPSTDGSVAGEAQYKDWLVYPRDVGGQCSADTGTFGPGSDAAILDDRSGRNWFIDCERSPSNQAFSPQDVTFANVDVVVSRNWIDVNSTAFRVHGEIDPENGRGGAILYLQGADNSGTNANSNKGLDRGSQASLEFQNTFVYSHNGWLRIGGGSGTSNVIWNSSPRDAQATCSVSGPPTPGCFAPLALWSNSVHEHRLGGASALDVRGIFFTPNASPFNLSGQSPQNLEKAQFFSHSFDISGQARITMRPDPAFNDPTPVGGTGLIR